MSSKAQPRERLRLQRPRQEVTARAVTQHAASRAGRARNTTVHAQQTLQRAHNRSHKRHRPYGPTHLIHSAHTRSNDLKDPGPCAPGLHLFVEAHGRPRPWPTHSCCTTECARGVSDALWPVLVHRCTLWPVAGSACWPVHRCTLWPVAGAGAQVTLWPARHWGIPAAC